MTADTNEALVKRLRKLERRLSFQSQHLDDASIVSHAADMLTAQAAKLAEAEGALMILMDERAHADRLAETARPFAIEASRHPDIVRLRNAIAAHQKRRAG